MSQGDLAKIGTTKYDGGIGRYTVGEMMGLRMDLVTLTPIPSNIALALEKMLILKYCLGGYNNQRATYESRGIFTTYGKPIRNPIFR